MATTLSEQFQANYGALAKEVEAKLALEARMSPPIRMPERGTLEEQAGRVVAVLGACIHQLMSLTMPDGQKSPEVVPPPGLSCRLDIIQQEAAEIQKRLAELRERVGLL